MSFVYILVKLNALHGKCCQVLCCGINVLLNWTKIMQTTMQIKMHSKEISQIDWKAYFNKVTKSLANRAVNVEVIGFNVGDEMLAEDIMLQERRYDFKNHIM